MKRTLFILFVLLALLRGDVFAGAGLTGMDFLRIGTGARQSGMGGASAALADDVYAMGYNPAGLALLEENEVSFARMVWFENISYDCLSFAVPVERYGTFGGRVTLLGYGDIQGYNAGGSQTEAISAYDLQVVLSASRRVSKWGRGEKNIFAGANIKLVQERLHNVTATTVAVDAGGLYAPDWDVAGGGVRFGVCVENIGPAIKFMQDKGNLPLNMRFGTAYRRRTAGGSFCLSLDGNAPLGRNFYFCAGIEYLFSDFIALRAGYSSENNLNRGFSCGIGITGRMKQEFTVHFDHAFVPYDKLGDTHRISVRLCF